MQKMRFKKDFHKQDERTLDAKASDKSDQLNRITEFELLVSNKITQNYPQKGT